MRNDRVIVLAAIKRNPLALKWAGKEIWNDREFILMAVDQTSIELSVVFERAELRSDREFMLALVKIKPDALRFASKDLKNDREVVLAAVQVDGKMHSYCSAELRNDEEILKVSTKQLNSKWHKYNPKEKE